jgi:hypothetical protein
MASDDLSTYRDARQARSDHALILLFSEVLSKPLELRELTPEQQARRDARVAARRSLRSSLYGRPPVLQPIPGLPPVQRTPRPRAAPESET